MAWPKEVPILTARDMCREEYDAGTRHCLMGWCYAAFDNADLHYRVEDAIRRECKKICKRDCGVLSFNDDPANSKQTLAAVWNRTMAKLGYVTNNPEAK